MFWCAKCEETKEGVSLKIASRDGSTLHSVCSHHVPSEHGTDHAYIHNYVDEKGAAQSHEVKPNADGTIRTLVFEDLV